MVSHWESCPTFPLEEWLGQQKNILTREYLPEQMSGNKDTGGWEMSPVEE